MCLLAVLTGWPHQRASLIRKCMGVSPGQKSGRTNEVTVRKGSTLFTFFYKVLPPSDRT